MSQSTTALQVKAAVERLGQTFEAFKANNDAAEIERRTKGYADHLIEEKLGRLSEEMKRLEAQIDGVSVAANRPSLSGDTGSGRVVDAHKSAFVNGYVRKGLERDVARLEEKSLNIATPSEGGYAVPMEIDHLIEQRLKDLSPIRSIASVTQIGSANYRKLVATTGPASGWVGESDARAETASPDFAEIAPPMGEIFANPAATQTMLDDAFFDVESWLAGELALEFAQKEGAAFISGDGINKPKGFLASVTSAANDATRAFGAIQHVSTGVAGDFSASDPADHLFDLVHSLKAGYRAGAQFVMNSATLNMIRKFKDADGDYLWRPGLQQGQASTLLGFPVVEAEDMPDVEADSLSVAFGNFQRGYLIADRMGTRVLRDPYSNKPFVHFYTTRRVGGSVVNSDAIKLLKFSAA
ncbi:phage capsid protein [Iodidimonas muriae]|uniref:Phage capsid protein n=1 Tax=Iodidimonas muriae TaxID=261467 RepID=A0ABQ2LE90_9PROT|nr:phage major capsid protein [Iodidimonas muriae]GER08224.1 phage capsid protein [Kordiimonadales bacterium JCM 17843]GGO12482.1 phage capsid protein [Iodidimonas muriae]